MRQAARRFEVPIRLHSPLRGIFTHVRCEIILSWAALYVQCHRGRARDELTALPADILTTRLEGFIEPGCFTARYEGLARGEIEQSFEQNLARIFARAETPRISGRPD